MMHKAAPPIVSKRKDLPPDCPEYRFLQHVDRLEAALENEPSRTKRRKIRKHLKQLKLSNKKREALGLIGVDYYKSDGRLA